MDQQRNLRRTAFVVAVLAALDTIRNNRPFDHRQLPRSERRTIHPGGPELAVVYSEQLLNGPDQRFFELFRMDKITFWKLHQWLVENADLKASRWQSSQQKLLIFLWTIAFNESQRNTAHKFQVSQSSVSKIIHEILPKMVVLFKRFVRLPDDNFVAPEVELDFMTEEFSGAIGAIDGTYIHAYVSQKHQKRWRNRKGFLSQNVFAAVRFDGTFSYVLAGAEGSMHDSIVAARAFGGNFRVAKDRFYLADAGFGLKAGILVPFSGVRYHLEDWRNGDRQPENPKELYNLRHARIRVIVEQVFGVLKRKFKIIRSSAPEYSIGTQRRFVYAVCGLHNFIKMGGNPNLDPEESLDRYSRALLAERKRNLEGKYHRLHPRSIRETIAIRSWDAWQRSLAEDSDFE